MPILLTRLQFLLSLIEHQLYTDLYCSCNFELQMNIYSYHFNEMSFAVLSLRTIKFLIFRIL